MLVIEGESSSAPEQFFDAQAHPEPERQAESGDEEEEELSVPKWKGKGKEVPSAVPDVVVTSHVDGADEIDWKVYDPPKGLFEATDVPDIISQVIRDSVDKIKARIAEEEERRKAEETAERLRREEEERLEREKGKEAEAPEVSVNDDAAAPNDGAADEGASPSTPKSPSIPPSVNFAGTTLRMDANGLLVPAPAPQPKKRSFMALLRRLNHSSDKGETSAAGAARHKHTASSGSIDYNSTQYLSTVSGRRRLALDVIKKVTSHADSSSTTSSVQQEEETVECVSCLDDFSPKDTIKAPCHHYCTDCFSRLITAACDNEQQWPPKCCLNTIPERTINGAVDGELQSRYRERAAEWNIPVSDRVYCSDPNCSIWVRTDQINHALSIARCTNGHWTCTMCRGPQHDGEDCPQDRELVRTNELAEEEGWRRCIGCRAFVEHREACQHMTCRCGAEFCYVCGARWRTCGCTMEQLNAIKTGAETRRAARLEREAQEEAETQEALRQVEEFEREEARKAELLRLERERLAEERRQKELEERIRREGARRRAVEVKFQDLREALALLHGLQRVAVAAGHSRESDDLSLWSLTAVENLQRKQAADRERMLAETNGKLAASEGALRKERETRIAEESRIEEKYHKQLNAYWVGKRGGDQQIETALTEFRRKMDKGFKAWEKWMQNEIERERYETDEEQNIQEELMEDAKRRLGDLAKDQQESFAKRKVAELKWVEVAVHERDVMLNEMEVDEIENGEDIESWFAEPGLEEEDLNSPELRIPGAFA